MLFSSYEFLFLFLPVTFFVYFFLTGRRLTLAAKAWLVFASLVFYAWWKPQYLPIILCSVLFNYAVGGQLARGVGHKRRKALLAFGVAANVALLGYYKYTDFIIGMANHALSLHLPLQNILLPLGISFFTFQQIAYLVDSYRRETTEHDLLNYSLFVTFFPQLIAGPIVHHADTLPQFSRRKNLIRNYKNISTGLFLLSVGLFKKVCLADFLSRPVAAGFDRAVPLEFFEAWGAALYYTLQLYLDFSGYMDMALGLGLLFNIRLPINFDLPYSATSIQDFWRRWHITLSRFLRDYIYIPLGGNRKGSLRTYANLMTTFLIGGLWHGAGWTFIFWGFLHGAGLVVHRLWSRAGLRLPAVLARVVTFVFVVLAWVFFRATSWDHALRVLSGMAGANGAVLHPEFAPALDWLALPGLTFAAEGPLVVRVESVVFALLLIFFTFFVSSRRLERWFRPNVWYLTAMFVMVLLSVLNMYNASEFLYFNF